MDEQELEPTVYVVTAGPEGGHEVLAAFQRREAAEAYLELRRAEPAGAAGLVIEACGPRHGLDVRPRPLARVTLGRDGRLLHQATVLHRGRLPAAAFVRRPGLGGGEYVGYGVTAADARRAAEALRITAERADA